MVMSLANEKIKDFDIHDGCARDTIILRFNDYENMYNIYYLSVCVQSVHSAPIVIHQECV